jgi:hypothetical protein
MEAENLFLSWESFRPFPLAPKLGIGELIEWNIEINPGSWISIVPPYTT